MCLPDRVLVFGDCAVNPDPSAEQLADIAVSSVETAKMFGIEPYVAMLSYSTGESGKGEEVEKVRKATSLVKELRPDIKIEGPIQVRRGHRRRRRPNEAAGERSGGPCYRIRFPGP